MERPRITVMGSFIVDLMARAPRLPVHGETVKGSHFQIGPGGKGSNQGVAAARAGADVTMITKIGSDAFAQIALESFHKEGLHDRFIMQDERHPTGTALIMVDENTSENQILVTVGACGHITPEEIDAARGHIEGSAVLLTQLETNMGAVERAVRIAHECGARVILNPAPAPAHPLPDGLLAMVDILTPNETEASVLSGVPIAGMDDARRAAMVLRDRGVRRVIITMGSKGAMVVGDDGEPRIVAPIPVAVVDTTGAGDAFNGGLATALAEGRDLMSSVAFANATGALSVTRLGTAPAMPYRDEIESLLRQARA